MRTFVVIFLFLLISAGVYVGYAHFSGGQVPTFGLPIGGEKAKIREAATNFFEQIKFRNYDGLERYTEEVTKDEIASYIKELFGINKNDLDLDEFSIKNIEMDSSKLRSRVVLSFTGRDVSTQAPFERQKMVFLYLNKDKKWLFDIKNNLVK